ncbi:MAG TPA: hypothetical protein VGK10_01920 [Prolixibacteraceae bacterium]|jgi:cell division FtsZ-interacting protein ZapD
MKGVNKAKAAEVANQVLAVVQKAEVRNKVLDQLENPQEKRMKEVDHHQVELEAINK